MSNMQNSFYIPVRCKSLMLNVSLLPQPTAPTARQVQPWPQHMLSNKLLLQGFNPILLRLPALFCPRTKCIK